MQSEQPGHRVDADSPTPATCPRSSGRPSSRGWPRASCRRRCPTRDAHPWRYSSYWLLWCPFSCCAARDDAACGQPAPSTAPIRHPGPVGRRPEPLPAALRALSDRMRVASACRGGVIDAVAARSLGADSSAIRRLCGSGEWHRVRRGVNGTRCRSRGTGTGLVRRRARGPAERGCRGVAPQCGAAARSAATPPRRRAGGDHPSSTRSGHGTAGRRGHRGGRACLRLRRPGRPGCGWGAGGGRRPARPGL